MSQNSELISAAIQMAHLNFHRRSDAPASTNENYETALRQKIVENYNWLKSITAEVSLDDTITGITNSN